MSTFKEELGWLLKAKTKCIWIRTYEEQQVINEIKEIIKDSIPTMKLVTWSYFSGYQKETITIHEKVELPKPGFGPDLLLSEIIERQKEGRLIKRQIKAVIKEGKLVTPATEVKEVVDKNESIYLIKDFHLINGEKLLIRGIRDAKERAPQEMLSYNPIIVVSPIVSLPLEHEKLFTIMDYETPSKEQISVIINNFVGIVKTSDKYTNPEEATIKACIELAQGLTIEEVKQYCARSLVQHNTITEEMFYQARLDLIKKTGILEYQKSDSNMADMGGNYAFKEWIEDIQDSFSQEAKDFGVEKSKGFLALGPPGTAKTLAAEMIAKELNLPLLKFNMSSVMHSHVGQSEKNMSNAINIIKSSSPCILLIDEAEKTLSGTGSSNKTDGGTLMRVVGQLLEFLGGKDSTDVFTIMTSNDVSQLPPELTRSGRLDTMWYFGLPLADERLEIFKIHYSKTKAIITDEVIAYAASITEHLTGAEIKECVKVSMRKAFKRFKLDGNNNVIIEDIDKAFSEIIPVYESSKEKILALEDYARNRARMANESSDVTLAQPNVNILKYDDISNWR